MFTISILTSLYTFMNKFGNNLTNNLSFQFSHSFTISSIISFSIFFSFHMVKLYILHNQRYNNIMVFVIPFGDEIVFLFGFISSLFLMQNIPLLYKRRIFGFCYNFFDIFLLFSFLCYF